MRRQLPPMTFLDLGKRPPATQPRAPCAPARQMGCRGRFGHALARYSAHAWLLLVLPDLVRTSARRECARLATRLAFGRVGSAPARRQQRRCRRRRQGRGERRLLELPGRLVRKHRPNLLMVLVQHTTTKWSGPSGRGVAQRGCEVHKVTRLQLRRVGGSAAGDRRSFNRDDTGDGLAPRLCSH